MRTPVLRVALVMMAYTAAAHADSPVLNSLATAPGTVEGAVIPTVSLTDIPGESPRIWQGSVHGMVRLGLSHRTDIGLSVGTDGLTLSARWSGRRFSDSANVTWSVMPSIRGLYNRWPNADVRSVGVLGSVRGIIGVHTRRGEWLVSPEVELFHVRRAQAPGPFTRLGAGLSVGYAAHLFGGVQLVPSFQAQRYRARVRLDPADAIFPVNRWSAGLTVVVGRNARPTP